MGSRTTTTQNNKPYAAAEPLIKQGLGDARSMYEAGGFNIAPYEGPLVAGYDPFRSQADMATPGAVGASIGAANRSAGILDNLASSGYQSDALAAAKQSVISDIMPAINATFSANGRTGSGLHQQNLAAGLAKGIAPLEYDALNRSQAMQFNAAQAIPGMIADANYGGLDYLRGAGQDRQAYQQQVIAADALQDQQRKSAELNALQDYLALSTGAGSMFGVQSASQSQSPGVLGALGFGLQAAPFLFSDERLKEGARRVGWTDEGLPIYVYRYKGSDTSHMGVMAQDVERVRPEAVVEVCGYKAVDYGHL